jgi:hypothetical protein
MIWSLVSSARGRIGITENQARKCKTWVSSGRWVESQWL